MRKALEPLILSWRVPELRNRLIFVLVAMVAYVFTIHIPVPNVDPSAWRACSLDAAGILGFLDIFGGGALSRLSILALGIMPYITSSIVFQILTIAFLPSRSCRRKGSMDAAR
jgi:preprotein translocase subunit SecY